MGKAISSYSRYLNTWPVTTKMCTGIMIMGVGDMSAQFIIEQRETLDIHRLRNI